MSQRWKVVGLATLTTILTSLTPASLLAQPATAPATSPALEFTGEAIPMEITGVDGNVQVRLAEDQPWVKAVVGMKIDQGAEFRTAPRSAVRFVIPPDQTITLDRLGTVKVLVALQAQNKVKTDLGMKYGRTRYDIEAAGIEHESTVRSPGATLAVRGTQVSLWDQPPFAPQARSLTGRATFAAAKNAKKKAVAFGAKGKKTKIDSQENTPAETALAATYVDPVYAGARTEDEQRLLLIQQIDPFRVQNPNQLVSSLATFLTGGLDTISAQENRNRPTPGTLAFDLVWTGPVDLDLTVTSPRGERLTSFPIVITNGGFESISGARRVPSGGQIDFEDQGPFEPDAPANGGRETAYWTSAFPKGKYTINVNYAGSVSPADAAALSVGVVQNGEVKQTFTGTSSKDKLNNKFTIQVR